MPIRLSPLCRGRPRPFVLALLLGAVVAAPGRGAPADPTLPQPVERFRKALSSFPEGTDKEDDPAFKQRVNEMKAELDKQADGLHSIGEMSRALLLPVWRADADPTSDSLYPGRADVVKAQAEVRERLAGRLRAAVVEALKDPDAKVRAGVATLLGETAAASRRPGTSNRFLRERISNAGPALIALLEDRDPAVREAAIAALGQIEPQPKLAVEALTPMLGARDPARQLDAVQALAQVVLVPAELARKIGSERQDRSYFRATAQAAVPLLSRALLSDNADVRRAAVTGLHGVSRSVRALVEAPTVDPSLIIGITPLPEVKKKYDEERRQLVREREEYQALLKAFRDEAPRGLTKVLRGPDATARLQAAAVMEDLAGIHEAISKAAPLPPERPGQSALPRKKDPPSLLSSAEGRDGGLVLVAYRPQAAQPGPFQDVLADLLPLLKDPNERVRLGALDALEAMGAQAAGAIPALVEATRTDRSKFVRWQAMRVLGKLAPRRPELVVPALRDRLDEPDPDVRAAAAVALAHYGPEARAAVAALADAIRPFGKGGQVSRFPPAFVEEEHAEGGYGGVEVDVRFRIAGMGAVEAIGPDAAAALPSVALNLRDTSGRITQAPFGLTDDYVRTRFTAAIVLGRFGTLARDQAPALRAALFDPEPDVRRAASEALLRVLGR
jgi:HEAT repeat protein